MVIDEDIVCKWIGICLMLTLYGVSIKELFSTDFVDFKARRIMSEQSFRRLSNCIAVMPVYGQNSSVPQEVNDIAGADDKQGRSFNPTMILNYKVKCLCIYYHIADHL